MVLVLVSACKGYSPQSVHPGIPAALLYFFYVFQDFVRPPFARDAGIAFNKARECLLDCNVRAGENFFYQPDVGCHVLGALRVVRKAKVEQDQLIVYYEIRRGEIAMDDAACVEHGGTAAHFITEIGRQRVPDVVAFHKLHYYFGVYWIDEMHKRRHDAGGLCCRHET